MEENIIHPKKARTEKLAGETIEKDLLMNISDVQQAVTIARLFRGDFDSGMGRIEETNEGVDVQVQKQFHEILKILAAVEEKDIKEVRKLAQTQAKHQYEYESFYQATINGIKLFSNHKKYQMSVRSPVSSLFKVKNVPINLEVTKGLPDIINPRDIKIRLPIILSLNNPNIHTLKPHLSLWSIPPTPMPMKKTYELRNNSDGKSIFSRPLGLAIHPMNEKIFVVNTKTSQIVIVDKSLTFEYFFGNRGSERGYFFFPSHIQFTDEEEMVLSDWGNNRIQIYDAEMNLRLVIGGKGTDSAVQLKAPNAVAVGFARDIFVSEPDNKRIQRFCLDTGSHLSFIGEPSSEAPIDIASGLCISDAKELLAMGKTKDIVRVYNPVTGQHLRDIKVESTVNDNSITRGPNGGFVICDPMGNLVRIYSYEGQLLSTIEEQGAYACAMNAEGALYISSYLGHVSLFR